VVSIIILIAFKVKFLPQDKFPLIYKHIKEHSFFKKYLEVIYIQFILPLLDISLREFCPSSSRIFRLSSYTIKSRKIFSIPGNFFFIYIFIRQCITKTPQISFLLRLIFITSLGHNPWPDWTSSFSKHSNWLSYSASRFTQRCDLILKK